MLRRKLYNYESSSTSSEWYLPLMVLFCYTATILEPLLKPRSRDSISTPNILCAIITLSGRSWIEVTSTFKKMMEERTRLTHLLKLSKSKSLMTTNQRWVYDTVPIGFSPSESCWKMCPKANH